LAAGAFFFALVAAFSGAATAALRGAAFFAFGCASTLARATGGAGGRYRNGGKKHVSGTVVRGDETKALRLVEKLDGAFDHELS
jgi:hypothetical protein